MDNNNQDSSKNVIVTVNTDNICDDIQKERDVLNLSSGNELITDLTFDEIDENNNLEFVEEEQTPRGYYDTPKDEFMQIDLIEMEYKNYPKLYITALAQEKMRAVVKMARPNEITWLPVIDILEDDSVRVLDIFVPGQECTESTTEVTSDGESVLYSELIGKKETATIKKLIGWGHSHVEMPVYASNTDVQTTSKYIETFSSKNKTHFVRLIANYFDDMFVSIYLLKKGIVIHNAEIVIEESLEVLNFDEWAKTQIEEKVKVITLKPFRNFIKKTFDISETENNEAEINHFEEKESNGQERNF